MALQQSGDGFAVKVTSKSLIKPASPTPPNFRQFNLSLLDQLYPSPLYPTFVLFYPPPPPVPLLNSNGLLLRESLSKTISHFYPLAGRIKGSTVDCNDQGAEYLEAHANQDMLHFLSSSPPPNIQLLRLLAPTRPKIISSESDNDMPLACLQITMFPCGGIALGICLNHTIADVHTCSLFLNHWASVFRGDTSINLYAHDEAASMYPTNDAVLKNKSLRWQIPIDDLPRIVEMPDIVLQRFVFKASQISELKSRIKSTEQVPYPRRTVAIFALIWKIAIKASSETTSPPKSAALVIVNLRPRFKTPLPEYSIGNIWWTAVSSYETTQNDDELHRVALQLKKSIEEVDAEFIENLKGEMGHKEVNKFLQGRGTGKGYLFTSIVRMGLNKVDFGWGNPIWVNFLGQSDILVPCGACLMEATGYGSNDNAVEAWVTLPEKEMAIFQQDPQLLQYAVVNPKVI